MTLRTHGGLADAALPSSAPVPERRQASPLAGLFAPHVADALDAALDLPNGLLATDADGTIWREDIGEAFLKALIRGGRLVSPQAVSDVYATYEAKVAADKASGYAWAVQVMAGLREADVAAAADAFAKSWVEEHTYPAMRALLGEANRRGCEPWIVSASCVWIVRAAAPYLGIDPNRALGLRVKVRGGVLTDEVDPPVTFRAGKNEALQAFARRGATIACGDSTGDIELLGGASGAALFIAHASTDPKLLALADEQRWLVQAL